MNHRRINKDGCLKCRKCSGETPADLAYCRHCGRRLPLRIFRPHHRGKIVVCDACELRPQALEIIDSLKGDPPGTWYQIVALEECCEHCKQVQMFALRKEDLPLVITPSEEWLPDCPCELISFPATLWNSYVEED